MIYDDKDYFDPDSEEELALALSRTIEEVFDKKEGVFIDSSEFFKKPEGELVLWRRALEESILIGKPRLVCSHCDQMVKLLGKRTARGKVAFFAHLHDSDDCEIKTTGVPMTKEEILAKKYGKVQESERHMRLKKFIADILSTETSRRIGFSDVEVEKRVKSNLPYLNWRRPDVTVNYNGKKLVFELQLSTTFLGVLVDRDIFYRLNSYYIIWVFNFDDNQEYVNLENLMCKDIYYANKRNVFILDKDAQNKSIEDGKLYLKCRWLDGNGKFTDGVLVSIDELSFDNEYFKPYYVDADEIYYKSHPNSRLQVQRLEHSRQEIIEGLMARMNKKYEEQLQWAKKQQRAIAKMKEIGANAEPYFNNGLYGYKFEDTILVLPFYKEAGEVGEDGYAHVSKARKQGLVDRFGMSVVPCLYKKILPVGNGFFIVRLVNQWKLFGREESIRKVSTCDAWYFKVLNSNLSVASLKHESRAPRGRDYSKEVDILIYADGSCRFFKDIQLNEESGRYNAHVSSPYGDNGFGDYGECEIDSNGITYLPQNADYHIAIDKNNCYGIANSNYIMIVDFSYQYLVWAKSNLFIAKDKDSYGVINSSNQQFFPFEYESVQLDHEDDEFWVVKREMKWGIVNDLNELLVPCLYDSLNCLPSKKWIAELNGQFGVISYENVVVVPIIYDSFKTISDSIHCSEHINYNSIDSENKEVFEDCWLVSKNGLYGLYDLEFVTAIPCVCKHIEMICDNIAIVTLRNNKKGVLRFYNVNYIVSPLYDEIISKNSNIFVCKTMETVTIINYDGEILFSHYGLDVSDIIKGDFVLVNEMSIWNLYDINSGLLIFRNCSRDNVIVNDNNTIDLTKCTDESSYIIRIDTIGKEIPVENEIEGTSYLSVRINNFERIVDKNGNTILPYGEYKREVEDGDILIKYGLERHNINEIVPNDVSLLTDEFHIANVCGYYGLYSVDWKEPIIPYAFTRIEPFNDAFRVYVGQKEGVFSKDGRLILYPIYHRIRNLSNGFYVCEYRKSYYDYYYRRAHYTTYTRLKDANGFPLLNQYNSIEIPGDYIDGKLCVKMNDQESYLDLDGNLILEDKKSIGADLYVYKLFGKYGIRNNIENTLLPIYDRIDSFGDGCIITEQNGRCKLLNEYYDIIVEGSIVECICDCRYLVGSNGYWNTKMVCDSQGKVIKPSFQGDIKRLSNGFIYLTEKKGVDWVNCFVNSDMEPIYIFDNSIEIVGDFKDGKIKIRNRAGRACLTEQFEILPIEEPLFDQYVKFEMFGKWGLKLGKEIVHEAKYDEIEYLPSIGYVLNGDCSALYSVDGQIIIGEDRGYYSIKFASSFPEPAFFVKKRMKGVGLCNKDGVEIFAPKYDEIEYLPSIGYVLNGDCSALYSVDGQIIIGEDRGYYSIKYTSSLPEPAFFVKKRAKGVGLCNKDGVEVIAPEYNSLSIFNNNVKVKKTKVVTKVSRKLNKPHWGRWYWGDYKDSYEVHTYGLMSPNGNIILPCKYSDIISISQFIFHGKGNNLNEPVGGIKRAHT